LPHILYNAVKVGGREQGKREGRGGKRREEKRGKIR
jgi:hypothetical protein